MINFGLIVAALGVLAVALEAPTTALGFEVSRVLIMSHGV